MKKAIKTILTIYMLLLLTVTFGINNNNISLLAATNTNSEYVNTVTDLKTTDLMGGVTLYEQKMTSLLNGDSQKAFQEHFVQWVDLKKENDVCESRLQSPSRTDRLNIEVRNVYHPLQREELLR